MAWHQLAGTCSNGPCPTFWQDDETGRVKVQGDKADPVTPMPAHEGIVEFSPEDWRALLEQLPRELLEDLIAAKAR
jgi:hypothetical protein